MKLLNKRVSWFQSITGGYFVAESFFKGKLKREVVLTIYDPKLDKSSYGYFYICEHNTLLVIIDSLTDREGVYELEAGDSVETVTSIEKNLKTILGQTRGAETYGVVTTTNPIYGISLNDRYLIIGDIQADLNYGSIVKGALATVIFTEKDDLQKTKNLVELINSQIKGIKTEFDQLLPGITPLASRVNTYAKLVILPMVIALMIGLIVFVNR